MRIKVLEGHLTAHQKAVVKEMLLQGLTTGRNGRTDYSIQAVTTGDWAIVKGKTYRVVYKMIDRGIIPCGGSEKRLSTYTNIIAVEGL